METIARVAWLPIVLSLIANMVALFGYLSVITGRAITFADVPTYFQAQRELSRLAARGFENSPDAMWMITGGATLVQAMLVASFMAPLIRYAGLGEKPAPGFVRAPFGPDQLRFLISSAVSFLLVGLLVFGPLAGATWYAMTYIAEAMKETLAAFPDPDSLHTIELTTAGATLSEQGMAWVFDQALPAAFVAPFALAFWAILFVHFHPKNRPAASGRGNVWLRGLASFLIAALLLLGGYFLFAELMLTQFRSSAIALNNLFGLASLSPFELTSLREGLAFILNSPTGRVMFFGVVSFFILNYAGLRLYAYPGVAVCRKSLAPGNTLKVTRGWDFIRLWVIVSIISALLAVVQVVIINQLMFQAVLPSIWRSLLSLTAVSTRLVNSGVTAEWVTPLFVWIWNILKIVVNIVWSFFSFGVAAGLYGRLYRESEKGA